MAQEPPGQSESPLDPNADPKLNTHAEGAAEPQTDPSADRSAIDRAHDRVSVGLRRLRLSAMGLGIVLVVVVASVAGWQWYDCLPAGLQAEYVGDASCIKCHQAEYEAWKGSDHDWAMRRASPETVLGDFSDVTVSSEGETCRFFKEGENYFAATRGPDGKERKLAIPFTFGVKPLQQYLVEFPRGRMQALPFAWDKDKKEWFYVPEDQNIRPEEVIHWANPNMSWNYMCAECHSTDLQKNYHPDTDTYDTTWKDINVTCEACHGPGSLHEQIVARGRWVGDRRYGTGLAELKSTSNRIQVDTCGNCHSRRRVVQPGYKGGEPFLDYFLPEILDSQAYYPDGQIREEDYEYTSFHLSLMYHKGVRCSDCHDPHSLKLKAQGNQLCIRCHSAGKYDAPSHHFHKVDSKGAQCVECHMPTTNYMKVDPRRDHSFRVPRPDLTISLGIPNACNRCHTDRTPVWSEKYVEEWYGKHPHPARTDFAQAIADGRAGKPDSKPALQKIVRDSSIPDFVRASALSLLSRFADPSMQGFFGASLLNESPLVRTIAIRNLAILLPNPGYASDPAPYTKEQKDLVDRLVLCLDDECDQVRMEAARALAVVPYSELPASAADKFRASLDDYLNAQEFLSDTAAANLNLASVYAVRGDLSRAEKYYRRALDRDPNYFPAALQLASLLDAIGKTPEAIEVCRSAIASIEREQSRLSDESLRGTYTPQLAQAYYSLGLLLGSERDQLGEAVKALKQSVALDSTNDRALYNLGIASLQLGKTSEAEDYYRSAIEQSPRNPDYLWALAILYAQTGRPAEARQTVLILLRLYPNHEQGLLLLQQLRSQTDS